MWLYETNCNEILQIIEDLKEKLSSGVDDISTILIRKTGFLICKHFVHLVNKYFKDGKFPSILKQTKIVPLHKAGAKEEITTDQFRFSLCGVKFLNALCIIEFILTLKLSVCSILINLVFENKHSTIDAIVKLTEKVRESRNCQVAAFFMDLRKAFDMIDHQILLQKLELNGIRGVCLRWISDYLSERQQCASVKTCNSSWLKLNCGVPQGSILGPLLF